jgi:hypothetical protein
MLSVCFFLIMVQADRQRRDRVRRGCDKVPGCFHSAGQPASAILGIEDRERIKELILSAAFEGLEAGAQSCQ